MYTVRRYRIQLKQNSHPEYTIELIADNIDKAVELAESLYGNDCLLDMPTEILNSQTQ